MRLQVARTLAFVQVIAVGVGEGDGVLARAVGIALGDAAGRAQPAEMDVAAMSDSSTAARVRMPVIRAKRAERNAGDGKSVLS